MLYILIFSTFCYAQETLVLDDCIKNTKSKLIAKLDSISKKAQQNPQESYNFALNILTNKKYRNNTRIQIYAHKLIGHSLNFSGKDIKARHHINIAYQLLTPKLKKSTLGISVTHDYACFFLQNNNLEYSLKLFSEVNTLLNEVCPKPNIQRFLNFKNIAEIYTKKQEFNKALSYYKKAKIEAEKLQNKLWLSSAYNNLGIFYYHFYEKNIEKNALSYYNKAKKQLDNTIEEHELFNANIDENIAHILKDQGLYKKSLAIYTNTSKIRRKYNKQYMAIQSDISRLHCFILQKNNKEVKQNIEIIDSYFRKDRNSNQNYSSHSFNIFSKLKLDYFKENKLYQEYQKTSTDYILFLNKKFKHLDSIDEKEISGYIDLQKQNFEKELKLEKEIAQKNEEIHLVDKKLLFIILIISALTIFTLLLLIKIKKTEYNQIKQENIINKLKLESKQKDIVNIVTNSSMRIDFLANILAKIKTGIKKDISKEQLIKPIVFELKSQKNIEERLVALQSDLSTVNAYFDTNLIEKYPNLTKMEREICSFIKLNLSTKEIANLRNTTADSVKMARYRIRKKLDIATSEELDQVIQSI